MKRSYFEIILLYCLQKINGERSIYSIYHLLNGKKSSQTIQDAHIFQLVQFFQLFPYISRHFFDQAIESLQNEELIDKVADQHYTLTVNGIKHLGERLQIDPIPKYLNGWKHHLITDLFWSRLTLLVQVISNLKYKETHYVPIQKGKDVQKWLKQFVSQYKKEKQQLSNQLRTELISLLDGADLNPSAFVIRLTGHQSIGLTAEQAAHTLQMEQTYYQIQFINVLHYLLERIDSEGASFPLMNAIVKDQKICVPLTHSTKRTYDLLQKGYSIEQIAIMRNLKESTIEDHIVELAFNIKNFNIHPYVSAENEKNILFAVNQTTSKQLKYIRQNVQEASYFDIRLVLAKHGAKKWT